MRIVHVFLLIIGDCGFWITGWKFHDSHKKQTWCHQTSPSTFTILTQPHTSSRVYSQLLSLQNASIISKCEKNSLNLDAKLVICGTIHFPKRTHNLFNCSYVIHSICFSKILNSFCIWPLETFFSSNSNIIKAQNQKCIITIIIIIHHKLDLSIVWIWSSRNKQNTFR